MKNEEEIVLTVSTAAHIGMLAGAISAFVLIVFSWDVIGWEMGKRIGKYQLEKEIRDDAFKCFLSYHFGNLNSIDVETKKRSAGGAAKWDYCNKIIKGDLLDKGN